ncbi:MAG: Putative cytochrome P450 hydroxylase, partial [uncultured Frankineae bacterium]
DDDDEAVPTPVRADRSELGPAARPGPHHAQPGDQGRRSAGAAHPRPVGARGPLRDAGAGARTRTPGARAAHLGHRLARGDQGRAAQPRLRGLRRSAGGPAAGDPAGRALGARRAGARPARPPVDAGRGAAGPHPLPPAGVEGLHGASRRAAAAGRAAGGRRAARRARPAAARRAGRPRRGLRHPAAGAGHLPHPGRAGPRARPGAGAGQRRRPEPGPRADLPAVRRGAARAARLQRLARPAPRPPARGARGGPAQPAGARRGRRWPPRRRRAARDGRPAAGRRLRDHGEPARQRRGPADGRTRRPRAAACGAGALGRRGRGGPALRVAGSGHRPHGRPRHDRGRPAGRGRRARDDAARGREPRSRGLRRPPRLRRHPRQRARAPVVLRRPPLLPGGGAGAHGGRGRAGVAVRALPRPVAGTGRRTPADARPAGVGAPAGHDRRL